ncbi:MAG: methylenetetrahydrofolate--tRNA-(uracil(54)-C(5))-methyltransferase (FADH(2)-oxidizing) TrmFO, partial [Clostridiales bacterium]|nr:methylenetetrahydrofolate--tRNA-(uracil(54)-C(5))-methyltransferase (FADH(2)-oxidizing) TrmFO [Clostridiales bacterium]
RLFGSLIIEGADATKVPAGGALAVDRDQFSKYVSEKIRTHPNITVVSEEITEIPDAPAIIATGPLTSEELSKKIQAFCGQETLHFYDAAAPIVTVESLNMDKIFRQSRYNRGDDYLNCPMNEEEYFAFVEQLIQGETVPVQGFEEKKVFESCMPVESMAKRGVMSLAFGPLKPVGLVDPSTGKEAFAVVQLRQENQEGTLYNLVGFQTRLTFPEQKRIFAMIPGLEKAAFARFGVMHRNTFLQSPGLLNNEFEVISTPGLYFSGQIAGIEGYVESAASGMITAFSLGRKINGKAPVIFPRSTAMGSLGYYVATPKKDFQPMHVSFGLIEELPVISGQKRIRNKLQRYEAVANRSLTICRELATQF